jgi:hypothetical protein
MELTRLPSFRQLCRLAHDLVATCTMGSPVTVWDHAGAILPCRLRDDLRLVVAHQDSRPRTAFKTSSSAQHSTSVNACVLLAHAAGDAVLTLITTTEYHV